jgi:hypothetical protein
MGFTISSFFVAIYSQGMESICICCLANKNHGESEENIPNEMKEFLKEVRNKSQNKGK